MINDVLCLILFRSWCKVVSSIITWISNSKESEPVLREICCHLHHFGGKVVNLAVFFISLHFHISLVLFKFLLCADPCSLHPAIYIPTSTSFLCLSMCCDSITPSMQFEHAHTHKRRSTEQTHLLDPEHQKLHSSFISLLNACPNHYPPQSSQQDGEGRGGQERATALGELNFWGFSAFPLWWFIFPLTQEVHTQQESEVITSPHDTPLHYCLCLAHRRCCSLEMGYAGGTEMEAVSLLWLF